MTFDYSKHLADLDEIKRKQNTNNRYIQPSIYKPQPVVMPTFKPVAPRNTPMEQAPVMMPTFRPVGR